MKIKQLTLLAFVAFILFRLVSIGLYPLMDTTEARYGEIARIMVDSNNWLTPQIDYNIPFWGKPPMHTWASALSIHLLGDSEFAIRLPHLITGLMTLLVVFLFATSNDIYLTYFFRVLRCKWHGNDRFTANIVNDARSGWLLFRVDR